MEALKNISSLYTNYIRPAADIALLTFLLYKTYEILVKTQAIQLLKGAFAILIIYAAAFIFKLDTLLWILHAIAPGIVIGVAIVFQPELRKMFLRIGQGNWLRNNTGSQHRHIDSIVTAAEILSEKRRGMLAVFVRRTNLKDIIDTGIPIQGKLSSSLLITIFGHDTPMHDGAVIIQNGEIISAGCFLPLSEQHDIRKTFGTRHRAALGVTEETDAVVLVVSEETGYFSLAYDSKLYYDLDSVEVTKQLEYLLDIKSELLNSKGDSDEAPADFS